MASTFPQQCEGIAPRVRASRVPGGKPKLILTLALSYSIVFGGASFLSGKLQDAAFVPCVQKLP